MAHHPLAVWLWAVYLTSETQFPHLYSGYSNATHLTGREEMSQSSGLWSLPKPEPMYLSIILIYPALIELALCGGTVLGTGKTDKWMKYKILSFNVLMF